MKPWTKGAKAKIEETGAALQTIYDALNKGQQQKILKDEKVKALFDRYGVVYADENSTA